MSRIETVNPANATGKAKVLLDGVKAKLGMTPNLMRVKANSPAVLDAYLKFSGALGEGDLDAKTRLEPFHELLQPRRANRHRLSSCRKDRIRNGLEIQPENFGGT